MELNPFLKDEEINDIIKGITETKLEIQCLSPEITEILDKLIKEHSYIIKIKYLNKEKSILLNEISANNI